MFLPEISPKKFIHYCLSNTVCSQIDGQVDRQSNQRKWQCVNYDDILVMKLSTVARRSAADPASTAVKLAAPSPASVQTVSPTTTATSADTSIHQSSVSNVVHDDAVCRRDLLRVLAEVNFIYGEVQYSFVLLVILKCDTVWCWDMPRFNDALKSCQKPFNTLAHGVEILKKAVVTKTETKNLMSEINPLNSRGVYEISPVVGKSLRRERFVAQVSF